MLNVLFIDGIRDDTKANIIQISDRITFDPSGSCNIYNKLDDSFFNRSRIVLDSADKTTVKIENIHVIFNQISNGDTHIKSLNKTAQIIDHFKLPYINNPKYILNTTRDKIYENLKGIDRLIVPKTIKVNSKSPQEIISKIRASKLKYPIIIREAGSHGGQNTYLVKNDKEIKELYAIALDGRSYYLTQYYDCIENGMYNKTRLVVVDGEVFIRHVIQAKEWMVHSGNQIDDSAMKLHEANRFLAEIKPNIQPIITDIYRCIGLDYFGIDCNIDKNMNLIIFEVNASMNVFAESENSIFSEHIKSIRNALIKMIMEKKS